jgi:hypothetical protein
MEKISNEQVVELLTDASSTIRKQASTIATLEEKLAAKELHERAEKLASAMHTKGLRIDTQRDNLVEEIEKEAAAGRLDTIEKAVEMVGPDMGKFARVNTDHTDQGNGSSGSSFEQFILG